MTYIPFIGPHNFQISLGARGKKRRTMPTRCDETRLVARWHWKSPLGFVCQEKKGGKGKDAKFGKLRSEFSHFEE